MERYAAGDEAAFGDLYDLLAPRLYGYLLRRCRNVQQTEDLLQQTLLHVHRARGSFIPGADVMPWVFAIARRLVIDSARSAKRDAMMISDDEDGRAVAATTADAADVLQARQLAAQMEGELARLPEPQRAAFELVKRHGLSLDETANKLKITVGAVKLRLHRAQQALRARLTRP
jgi:RNA polymerase sigma-70 factor (ECF subfamily)